MTQQLENFKNEFFEYYSEIILTAEFDEENNLIVFVRPDVDFDESLKYLSDSILDTVDFEEHMDVHVYAFGSNEFMPIGIN